MIDLKRGIIEMGHGSGGRAMAQLIDGVFVKYFDNELLRSGNDFVSFPPPRRKGGDEH